jgi:predicted lipoprotein with Yx(FWY)xxD motif
MYPNPRHLRRGLTSAASLAAFTLALAACGAGGSSAYGAGGGYGAAPATPSAVGTAATVDLRASSLGQIVVDAQGRTLYLFEADKGGKSACDGPCATAWPPYLSNGAPQAGTGASGGLISTSVRGDGTTQVTYGGTRSITLSATRRPATSRGKTSISSAPSGTSLTRPAQRSTTTD